MTAGGLVHLHVICQTAAYLSSSFIRLRIRSKRAFVKRSERVRILAIKVITINKTIHTDTVIVVLADTVTERPEITLVNPVGGAVFDFTEQHNGRAHIMTNMIVIMENTFA